MPTPKLSAAQKEVVKKMRDGAELCHSDFQDTWSVKVAGRSKSVNRITGMLLDDYGLIEVSRQGNPRLAFLPHVNTFYTLTPLGLTIEL